LQFSSRFDTITLRYVNVTKDRSKDKEDAVAPPSKKVPMNFKSMPQADVPQGRNGKHKQIVTRILSDLDQVESGVALKVPLAQLAESKEKVRSALNRATRQRGRQVATASDDTFLYVWTETS
jgi:hypothetical protein